jgi:hypothetical protein
VSSKANCKIASVYGLIADLDKLSSHNLAIFLLCQSAFLLYSDPQNLACHNLCIYLQPPKNYHSLLGLGLNFCPKPITTTNLRKLQQVSDHFCQDIYTQMFFAGSPDEYNPNQLFIGSDWEPGGNTIAVGF